ncbi:hypothetical protein Ancab_011565 [Ancistrocladus abbreviatus]
MRRLLEVALWMVVKWLKEMERPGVYDLYGSAINLKIMMALMSSTEVYSQRKIRSSSLQFKVEDASLPEEVTTIVLQGSCFEIHNQGKLLIWTDPWFPTMPKFVPIPRSDMQHSDVYVKDLITGDLE